MKTTRNITAFTLVELLVALVVTGILLSAVATLAFAMSSAVRASDDMAYAETQLRGVTPRLLDLVRYSHLICARFDNNLVIWRADDNHNELIDVNEVAYLEYDDPNHVLSLWEFVLGPKDNNPDVLTALGLAAEPGVLAELAKPETKTALKRKYLNVDPPAARRSVLLRGCSGAQFALDAYPPVTKRVAISFTLAENDSEHYYEIGATILVSAQHLLSGDPPKLVSDDD